MKRSVFTWEDMLMPIMIIMILTAISLTGFIESKKDHIRKMERQKNIDRLNASYRKTLVMATERLMADETSPLTKREKEAFSERAHRFKDKDGQPYLATYETVLAAFTKRDWANAQKAQALCAKMTALIKEAEKTKQPAFEDIEKIISENEIELDLLFKKTE